MTENIIVFEHHDEFLKVSNIGRGQVSTFHCNAELVGNDLFSGENEFVPNLKKRIVSYTCRKVIDKNRIAFGKISVYLGEKVPNKETLKNSNFNKMKENMKKRVELALETLITNYQNEKTR